MDFPETGLSDTLLRAVADAGYLTPTPIQQQAIPIILTGRDVMGLAQTGTGKTAAFTLPMIEILAAGRAKARMPRSLILEPTRELAMQVAESFNVYGKYQKLNKALLIGGVSFADQERLIDRGVDVLIATPGRLLDHLERGKILLNDIKVLVIDEADRMLDMGFMPDVERIVSILPAIRQTLMFSATMPSEIRRLSERFLLNPREIAVAPPASPSDTVDQVFALVPSRDKREALRQILRTENIRSALIFCNRKRDVGIVYRSLKRHGFDAGELHGDMSQAERFQTLDALKEDRVKLLVCSDVAARGLDIHFLSHVINFDVPTHSEDYIHRIGRTARAGRAGRAITIATPEEARAMAGIRRLLGRDIPSLSVAGISIEGGAVEEDGGGDKRRGRGRRTREAPRGEGERAGGGRGRERKRPAKAKPEAKEPEAKKPAAKRPAAKGRAREEAVESVVGMGDHVPAFLRRPGPSQRR